MGGKHWGHNRQQIAAAGSKLVAKIDDEKLKSIPHFIFFLLLGNCKKKE
jgi:hypothetical protein